MGAAVAAAFGGVDGVAGAAAGVGGVGPKLDKRLLKELTASSEQWCQLLWA